MRFESRELKPFSEPVEIGDLKIGQIYFSVIFSDKDMLVPCIDTLVLIEERVDDKGRNFYCFQEVMSLSNELLERNIDYCQPIFYEYSEDELNNIFLFEKALDLLMLCSLRRRAKGM